MIIKYILLFTKYEFTNLLLEEYYKIKIENY